MKYFSIVLLSLLLATSCNKESEPNNNPILNGAYKNTSIRYSPPIDYDRDGNPEIEVINLILDCDKDDLIVFVDSKRGYYDNGLLICSPATEYKIDNFSWWLIDNYHSLDVEYDLYPEYRDTSGIEILSENVFILIDHRNTSTIKDFYTVRSTFTKVK